jgi:hypothetical protein
MIFADRCMQQLSILKAARVRRAKYCGVSARPADENIGNAAQLEAVLQY